MEPTATPDSRRRLDRLEEHLRRENPTLLRAVQGFRALDRVAQRLHLLDTSDSYAAQVPWFPVVAVLGTFSAGKSSFVNHFLGHTLQRTGNQAVDDKFTVICHAAEEAPRTLPGSALDADPRFPFFRISAEIDKVAPGEGRRIDSYMQLKTSPADGLRGKILIDSPGFDADEQRTSILRIVDRVIELSDLVLVFFDARHPEPGAMRDTLEHLVLATRGRHDTEKFVYVLNQIDATAREDNLEEVIASWQRGLAEHGLSAGRFYAVFMPEVAMSIEDETARRRLEGRREADLGEILGRIQRVEVSRAYRILGELEKASSDLRNHHVPKLSDAIARWRRLTIVLDALLLAAVGIAALVLFSRKGFDETITWWRSIPGFDLGLGPTWIEVAKLAVVALVLWFLHTRLRLVARGLVRGRLAVEPIGGPVPLDLGTAFLHSTRWIRSIWCSKPSGWSPRAAREVDRLLGEATAAVQDLNDAFADPSGEAHPATPGSPAPTSGETGVPGVPDATADANPARGTG